MALINCPICGREKISDSAELCPSCGFKIKKHFEDMKEAERKRIEAEKQKKAEEIRIAKKKELEEQEISCPECKQLFPKKLDTCPHCGFSMNDKESVNRLRNIEFMEQRAKKEKRELLMIIPLIIVLFLLTILFALTDAVGIASILGIISFLALFGIMSGFNDIDKLKADIKLAKEDYNAYQLKSKKESDELMARIHADNAKRMLNHPACPNCGSHNTEKISTVNRATSVMLVGIASSKIGKQYQCKRCKHKW